MATARRENIDGNFVTGWPRADDFDYDAWRRR